MMATTFVRCSFCEKVGKSFSDGVEACKKCRNDPKIAKKVILLADHYSDQGWVVPEIKQIRPYELEHIMLKTCYNYHNNCELKKYPKLCCMCSDKRLYSSNNKYINYVDGQGDIPSVTRYEHYCPTCKQNCEVSVKEREDQIKADHEKIIQEYMPVENAVRY
jgi:hypothetical protein